MKKRISKFELLRIIAMYLIVLHHSIIHGALEIGTNQINAKPINAIILSFLECGGKIGVFLFVLITGYFMIYSKISFKKLVQLWLPIFFWSVSLYLIMSRVMGYSITIKDLIKSFFPIIFAQYWFMTAYFFMYLLIPLLNILVKNINSKIRMVYFISLGIILIATSTHTLFNENAGSMLLNFCVVYCWGGLIRIYHSKINRHLNLKLLGIFSLFELIGIELPLICFLISGKTFLLRLSNKFIVAPSTLFMVLIAVTFFISATFWRDKYYPIINLIASTTFGIYLISDNNNVRQFLWNNIFHMHSVFYDNFAPLYVILVSVLVFVVCSAIELIRKSIFRNFENYVGDLFQKVQIYFLNKMQ